MMMFDIPAHPTDKFWWSIILWWDKATESLKNVTVTILHHVKGVERKEPTKSSEMSEEEQSLM